MSTLEIESFGKLLGNLDSILRDKEKEMKQAAGRLDFELAALLRDEIKIIRNKMTERNKTLSGK